MPEVKLAQITTGDGLNPREHIDNKDLGSAGQAAAMIPTREVSE